MNYSKSAEQVTESFEGCRLSAYQDQVGKWTIGYGHTGSDVHAGMTITEEEALDLLRKDLSIAASCVTKLLTAQLTQNEFDALVDFVFNLGCGTFYLSTMRKLLNHGEIQAAALEFEKWDHAGGKVVAGLLRRRMSEEHLFDGLSTAE